MISVILKRNFLEIDVCLFQVLESFKIMDYSLLVGIHNKSTAKSAADGVDGGEPSSSDQVCIYCIVLNLRHFINIFIFLCDLNTISSRK